MTELERPLSALVGDALGNVREIARSELKLAKAEVLESAHAARLGVVLVSLGAVAAFFSVGFLLMAAMLAASTVMSPWAASLTVAGAAALIAALTFVIAVRAFRRIKGFPKTSTVLKENAQWTKQQVK